MGEYFLIRRAVLGDIHCCVKLIIMAMGNTVKLIFGSRERGQQVLEYLFRHKNNRFSHEFVGVIDFKGQVVGMILGYPGHMLLPLSIRTFLLILREYSTQGLLGSLKTIPMAFVQEGEREEFCIISLAVFPEYSGQGLGRKLLEWAEKEAKGSGLKGCSLLVEGENKRAIVFYENSGYRVVGKNHCKEDVELYRMVKTFF